MNEPPDHTAVLSAANLLSLDGMIVPKCSLHEIGVVAERALSMSVNSTPDVVELLLDLVVDDLGLVLRAHAAQVLLLGLGDAQLVPGAPDVVRELVPVRRLLLRRTDEVVDVLEVDAPTGRRPTRASGGASKCSSAFSRYLRIQSGSDFSAEISSTTAFDKPRLGSKTAVRRVLPVEAVPLGELSRCSSWLTAIRCVSSHGADSGSVRTTSDATRGSSSKSTGEVGFARAAHPLPTLGRPVRDDTEEGRMDAAGGAQRAAEGRGRRSWRRCIVVGAIAVAATTGDSMGGTDRSLVVAADVAVRLWRWGEARRGRGPKPRPPR